MSCTSCSTALLRYCFTALLRYCAIALLRYWREVCLVCFVEDDADLVVVAAEVFNDDLQLVRNVELVRVEEEEDEVRTFRKPLAHLFLKKKY